MNYVLRDFRGEDDIAPIVTLIGACQAVDHLDRPETAQGLREELLEPTSGWTRDIALWEADDATGTLMGCANIWVPPAAETQDVYLWFIVHPDARDSSLVNEIIDWGEQRGQAATVAEDATLTVSAGDDDQWRARVIPDFGFTVERYFLRMRRSLDEPLPTVEIPDGYEIRAITGPEEAQAWVDIYNHAFSDHWEHVDTTLDERRVEYGRDNYRPHLDLVTVAPDGTFVGFCSGTIARQDDGRLDPWIALVGTHTDHRRKGLARAMIATTFAILKDEGYSDVQLSVDADSPTSAGSVYDALGFKVGRRITVFRRPLRRQGNS